MFLLDTNIISELRRPRPHLGVVQWVREANDAALYLSAVTIGEIQADIELTRMQDAAKAAQIEAWLDAVSESYNVLAMDAAVFRVWTQMMHKKSDTLIQDAMIAATAKVHGLIVVTRNVADFRHFDVETLNPFSKPTPAGVKP